MKRVAWHPAKPIGLARALHKAGYGTHRQTEKMVREGRVRIGNDVITDPYHMANTGVEIFLDDEILKRLTMRYFALHKPAKVLVGEAEGVARQQVQNYFPEGVPGLAAAGRMDGKTTGLLLISNDNGWNNMITTTDGLEQEYRLQVEGELTDLEVSVMSAGVHLPGLGLFRPQLVRIVEILNQHTVVNITIREGKIRQVRRMMTTLRHKVTLVRRVRIGDVRLSDLSIGSYRELNNPEIESIREINAAVRRSSDRTDNRSGNPGG